VLPRKHRPLRGILCAVLVSSAGAPAQELMTLLNKGPVVLVETTPKGKFDHTTAIVFIQRPVQAVWGVAMDFASYKTFMPKVIKSEPKPVDPNKVDVTYEIDTPVTNTNYTFRYDIDPANMTMRGNWVKGDLKSSYCVWKLVPYNQGTLLYYTNSSRNFSSLAEGFEDDQQTVTVGVNVASALAVVKAVKHHVEELPDGGG